MNSQLRKRLYPQPPSIPPTRGKALIRILALLYEITEDLRYYQDECERHLITSHKDISEAKSEEAVVKCSKRQAQKLEREIRHKRRNTLINKAEMRELIRVVKWPLKRSLEEVKLECPAHREINNDKECIVCLFSLKKHKVRTFECKHSFHMNCIDEWISMNLYCPICRRDLSH